MKEEDVIGLNVVFQDPFHLKNLYKLVKIWLEENGYLNAGVNETTLEVMYSEVQSGPVTNYDIWWRAEKQPDENYFKYKMKVDFKGLGIKGTEVIKDDKKYKMQIGEIGIQITGILVTAANDKKGEFDTKKGFIGYLNKWFRERWYRAKIEEHEDFVYEDTYKLQRTIKDYLELKQYAPTPDLFFNKKGFE